MTEAAPAARSSSSGCAVATPITRMPARRAEYVSTMAAIVRPGGWILACFYPIRQGGGGPPFPMGRREVRRLFAGPFRIERAGVPLHSVQRRQGQEWMVLFRKTC